MSSNTFSARYIDTITIYHSACLAWLKLHPAFAVQSWLAGVMKTYVSASRLRDLREGWRARSLTLIFAACVWPSCLDPKFRERRSTCLTQLRNMICVLRSKKNVAHSQPKKKCWVYLNGRPQVTSSSMKVTRLRNWWSQITGNVLLDVIATPEAVQ